MVYPFVLFSLGLGSLVGVFGVEMEDGIKSVSVMKGDPVTLNPDFTEKQKYLLIQWKFRSTRIAEVNRLAQTNSTYDGPDERFRGRLKLDQTGSLTITNTSTADSGLYQLTVVKKETIYISFNVTVYDLTEEENSILVIEGDSVTLNPEVTKAQRYLLIQWMYRSTRIAEVNRLSKTSHTYDADGRFTGRLKLDQTGSLTITNTSTADSGLYQLTVVKKETIYISFNVTVYDLTEEENSILVIEGDSVTLNPEVTKAQRYLLIQWMYRSTRIAEVNRLSKTSHTYDADGRFRGRLKLDQTGSLTITNTSTADSGLYKLAIVNKETSYMDYKVIVYRRSKSTNYVTSSGAVINSTLNQTENANITETSKRSSEHCCSSTEAVIRLLLSVLVAVAAVALLVYDIRSTRSELDMTEETEDLYETCGGRSDHKCELRRGFDSRYVQM